MINPGLALGFMRNMLPQILRDEVRSMLLSCNLVPHRPMLRSVFTDGAISNGCTSDVTRRDGSGKKEEIERRSLVQRHILIKGSFVVEDLDVKFDRQLSSDPVVGERDGRIPSYACHHLRQLFCLIDNLLPG